MVYPLQYDESHNNFDVILLEKWGKTEKISQISINISNIRQKRGE